MRLNKFILIILSILFVSLYSCKKDSYYLNDAIENDAIVCPLIYAKDSAIIRINISSTSILDEICHNLRKENPENFLCKSIKDEIAICVTDNFYRKYSYLQIQFDSVMNSIYLKQGVNGLLKEYFKKDMGMYILWNSEQLYFSKGTSPYPAFGQDHNIGYTAYLLSKHNIFLRYLWLDEDTISLIILLEKPKE